MLTRNTKEKKPETENTSAPAAMADTRIEKYYYKIVIGFVALTALLVVMIVYFAFSKTDIIVSTKPVTKEVTLEASLQDLDGVLLLTDLEDTVGYTDFTGVDEKEGAATGTVTITNETSDDQPLIETTRLLSEADNEEDRVLFRTQEYVVVPAGGSVDVKVAADEEGAAGDIGPSTFEIVALDDSLKSSVYGESSAPMTGGVSTATTVGEEDIENAQAEVRNRIQQKALDLFRAEVKTREGMPPNAQFIESVAIIEAVDGDIDASVGETVDEISVSQKLTVAAPVINTEALMEFINNEMPKQLDVDSTVTSNINPEEIQITLQNVSENQTNAQLQILLTVDTSLSLTSDILNKEKLVNKTRDEITEHLISFDEIENVEVKFSPFWARRTGGAQDSIDIEIEATKPQ